MLKPMLARGELHCIGATTLDEYRKHIEKDAALERRFQSVLVEPPSVEDTVSILRGLKERYEVHHGIRIRDAALVAAQRLGGGECVVYSAECDRHDPSQLALLAELRRAVEANELHLAFQPKVDLKTRTVTGAEALLRWDHPKRGAVSPEVFIPLAEKTGAGLMRPLTRWVLDRAAGEARGWERAGRQVPVAVNVSARSLHDMRIVDDIEETLLTHDLRPDRLQIEVTETAVMDGSRAAEVISGLSNRGVMVAIDDFGTGQTALAQLTRLPVHELKIDKLFVLGMAGDSGEETAIVRSAADLAHNLGLGAVAEGVENQWTLDLLASFGCDQAQGYYIARPMPAAAFAAWLGGSAWRVLAS